MKSTRYEQSPQAIKRTDMDTLTDFDAIELFRDSPEPMLVYDPDTLGIMAVNEAAIAQYGYSQGQDALIVAVRRDLRL